MAVIEHQKSIRIVSMVDPEQKISIYIGAFKQKENAMGCPNDIYVIAVMQSAKHKAHMSVTEKQIMALVGAEINKKNDSKKILNNPQLGERYSH